MTPLRVLLVVLAAAAVAAFTYVYLERSGRRGLVPLGFRTVAWAALGLLVLNLGCPAAGPVRRPLVLLDGSLSLTGPGGRWPEARRAAAQLGDVRVFGDERPGSDTLPDRGRSLLGPALAAASAGERPVIVVTDGEIDDAPDLPPDLLARAGVRLYPRNPVADVAITSVTGPARVTSGDSLALEAEVAATGGPAPDSVVVVVTAGQARLARRVVPLGQTSAARVRLRFSSGPLSPGDHLLHVALADQHDAEPRTDTRLHLVTVVPTPGVVLLAGPADWDARSLYRTLREVAQLPVRGYLRLEQDRWRSFQELAPVAGEQVRQAARRADLLILKGGVAAFAGGTQARGIWSWPSGESGEPPVPGDWYLAPTGASPLAAALAGVPVDSFPPAIQVAPFRPAEGDWVALTAQNGRRGPKLPVAVGRDDGRVRRLTVLADGLWRWSFLGGSSEEAYRAWVAAAATWLLAGADSVQGVARAVRPVVPNGRPVIFQWSGPGAPAPTAVEWSGTGAPPADTLRFDGAGRATAWLPVGEYRYRLARGGQGTVAVEGYSDELLPRPVALAARQSQGATSRTRRSARDSLWLFGLCIAALSGEWIARRRLGLR
jgi:hypothetical protein